MPTTPYLIRDLNRATHRLGALSALLLAPLNRDLAALRRTVGLAFPMSPTLDVSHGAEPDFGDLLARLNRPSEN